MSETDEIRRFLATHHPFDMLGEAARAEAARAVEVRTLAAGDPVFRAGETLPGLHAVAEGAVDIVSETGEPISRVGVGETCGERGLVRDGRAPHAARMAEAGRLYLLPAALFRRLLESEPGFARFFGRPAAGEARPAADTGLLGIGEIMTADPVSVAAATPAAEAARLLTERGISCLLVTESGRLTGLLTTSDLCARVLAAGRGGDTPVAEIMTPAPVALGPGAVGHDAVATMAERGIGHLPVVDEGRPVGIVTRTNLLRNQALSSPLLLGEIGRAGDVPALAAVAARVPRFLAQLVGAGAEAHVVTRLVTDVTDALTRRLLALAEAELGPPPVGYCWAVCGSQGRQEQTGVSDQDNCLILAEGGDDHDDYFESLARIVSDGLDACGFVHCPGGMMATNPQWRQPLGAWRGYFQGWIRTPDPKAQMLASVMFDLRAAGGDGALLEGLQAETLAAAGRNSIFLSHMIRNALTHQPPLGLFRGFALIRSGEHKNSLDLKLNGVVPVVDLARVYALMGGIRAVNTRARLLAAREAGIVSEAGGADLVDAYDLIAETRLAHQARQVRAGGAPDNFLDPATLSELERGHLKDAFAVIKTMQSALGQGRQTLG